MVLIETFIAYAKEADLKNSAPYDPVSPTYMVYAGDQGLIISGCTGMGESECSTADICLAFGLSTASKPDDIASLKLHYDTGFGAWQLEYDLKGEDPPPEVRALAERFGLVNPDEGVVLQDHQAPEIGKALIDYIKERLLRRSPILSDIPLTRFLADGGRLT